MKIISDLRIDHFRSIKSDELKNIGEFTAFAGLNNSGKSNILRALNAFFTNNTDDDIPLDHGHDYYRYDLSSKKKIKNIEVSLKFNLPSSFTFRKELRSVEALLGKSFWLKKAWSRRQITPDYYLNNDSRPLKLEDKQKIEQFLDLINFRYIPNRVQPLEIIRKEHKALRDVLIRNLSKKFKQQDEMFSAIKDTSKTLIDSLEHSISKSYPGIEGIRLDTPTSWQDLVFALGYRLSTNGIEIEDTAQGSGIQSLLMLETLSLIDCSYSRYFGWRQAAIWAIEEPESSLHNSLEAKIAKFISELVVNKKNRLQVLTTTHSGYVLQHADKAVLIESSSGTSSFKHTEKKDVLERSSKIGVTRYTHPILTEPLNPIVLVEGKYDHLFLSKAISILAPDSKIIVSYLELLDNAQNGSGGSSALLNYLKYNKNVIHQRTIAAPITVLLDWDAKPSLQQYKQICSDDSVYRVLAWPDDCYNPILIKDNFRGIESCMPTHILEEADQGLGVLGKTSEGKFTINRDVYNSKYKKAVNGVVMKGISKPDLIHCEAFVLRLIQSAETIKV